MKLSTKPNTLPDLTSFQDSDLIALRTSLLIEMKRRGMAINVGQTAERLAIDFYNKTAGCPNLMAAPTGTANVDALSRKGERYSIKGILDARKTGTVYPDADERDKQLFEFLLIVKLRPDWSLEAIYEFDWATFASCRSWDKRMNAWYVGLAAKTLALAKAYRPAD